MGYHPHVHPLVSGAGIAEDGTAWCEAKHPYLIPVRAASPILRAKFRELMEKRQPGLCAQQPRAAWTKKWNVWCKHTGQGKAAVLDYLARYVHRIAITNARIVAMDDSTVTFRYKERKKDRWRSCTLSGHEFMRQFLQHVLPKGFHKVRYYGLWNPKKRAFMHNACIALQLDRDTAQGSAASMQPALAQTPEAATQATDTADDDAPICPHCKSARTRHIRPVEPRRAITLTRASP